MSGRGLEMTSNQAEMVLKWSDSTSQATRTVEKPTFTSAAGLRVGYFRSQLGFWENKGD